MAQTVKKKTTNALPCGQLLGGGRYRIVRLLGEGGYGITYEALDLQTKKSVAVKEFFPAYALRRGPGSPRPVCVRKDLGAALPHARMRFHEEAALLFSLKNVKEIVDVYHSFAENNTAYYTMELLQGMDMQRRLQKYGRMSWQELSPIVIQILRALYATHQRGFIHRDITPDNIFLSGNGSARLIDFGNARRFQENQPLTAVVKDKFAPREQYSPKGKQGPWTDIYSLCVTIYYALTGILPQKATELDPNGDVLPPLRTAAQVPMEVSRAVQVGMFADENLRYQSIADFAYALYPGQTILGELTQQFTAPSANREPAQPMPARKGVTRPVQRLLMPKGPRLRRSSEKPMLVCTQGTMQGKGLPLPVGQVQTLGRGSGKTIRYSDETVGVSRSQCSVVLQPDGIVYVRDDRSSYGTAVNGVALPPGVWRPIYSGDFVIFGREMFVLHQRSANGR